MNPVFFTPGPSQLYPTVKGHIQQALEDGVCSISHRSAGFELICAQTVQRLKLLLGIPRDSQVFFLGSATEAMERVLQNCVERVSFHFINGAFAERFYLIAKQLGKEPISKEIAWGAGFDLKQESVPPEAELICVTQNETSTGVCLPPEEIAGLKNRFPDKFLAVDIVSSAPYVDLDFSRIDCAFFSVQKGFGLPAGLGVLIVNAKLMQRSLDLAKAGTVIGSYHSFMELRRYAQRNQTPETPNVLAIYLLGEVCQDYLNLGKPEIRRTTNEKAGLIYSFLDQSKRAASAFVKEQKFRSPTVISVDCLGPSRLLKQELSKLGLEVGSGYSQYKESQIRIANFPAHQIEEVEYLTSALLKIVPTCRPPLS